MKRDDVARAALLLLASLAGCDAGDDARDGSERPMPGVVGDWFSCANDACTELEPTGLRLAADHRALHLQAATVSGESASAIHFMDGDPYCVTDAFGRYEHHGEVLTLTLHDGGLVVDTELVLGDGGVTAHDGAMHKVAPNATGHFVDGECITR